MKARRTQDKKQKRLPMRDDLLEIVTNLCSPKVLLVGDFMLDVYVYGDALRISPEAPVPVLKVRETEYR